MITLDREELAWAAGFFDGEGSTVPVSKSNSPPSLSIYQLDKFCLDRFQDAVLGLGKVYGPYNRKRNNDTFSIYKTTKYKDTQAVIALLWYWLSPLKKQQILKVMADYMPDGWRNG